MKTNDIREDILTVVDLIDETLVDLAMKYDLHPVDLSAIVLARLVAIIKETNGIDSFLVLLEASKHSIMNTPKTDKTLH